MCHGQLLSLKVHGLVTDNPLLDAFDEFVYLLHGIARM